MNTSQSVIPRGNIPGQSPRPHGCRRLVGIGGALGLALALGLTPLISLAATPPTLGTAASFAVLAGSAVTNTGPTTLTGDLGLSPGSSVTGFPPGVVNGAIHVDDAVAVQAKVDLATAYADAAGQPCTSTLSGDLGGRTLVPGVYCFTSSAQLTGTLTLNGSGDPNAVFIFKIGSMLTTASNARVAIINGGPCGVFWQVGSSATLGTDTAFVGTLLVNTSITLDTGANILPGRALAQTGAVTLDSNLITPPPGTCTTASSSTSTSLTTSSNPSETGAPVTLTATVTAAAGGPVTGTVTFYDGSSAIGTAPVDTSGKASLTTSTLLAGSHAITAVYSGAPGFLPSTSPRLTQTVTAKQTPAAAPTPAPPPVFTPTPTASLSSGPGLPGLPKTGAGPVHGRLPSPGWWTGLLLVGSGLCLALLRIGFWTRRNPWNRRQGRRA